MATFRQQVETRTEAWAERHRTRGHHVSRVTEQAWAEADAALAAKLYRKAFALFYADNEGGEG